MEKGLSDYFWDNDFTRVVAPIITSSDCEGGGEVFQVESVGEDGLATETMSALDAGIAQEPSLSGSIPDRPSTHAISKDGKGEHFHSTGTGKTSFWSDSTAYLTVSSQLHLEAMALGLGRVYTVGPSFRAESSATNRHLAEFWMCEAELLTSSDGDAGLEQVMSVVEGVIKRIMSVSLGNGEADYLWGQDVDGLKRLAQCASREHAWSRWTYTQAIEALQQQTEGSFTIAAPEWGGSLASEHERWLARDGPIFITNYPASVKPFYMRQNDDQKTVACFDLLVPRIGELVGGSLREERGDVLAARLSDLPVSHNLHWYVNDLRKYGCNPHGGFGIGMERLLSFITNTENLRDCLTFPRVKGRLRF
jgi:asparaginyl-tRNA synthetase